VDDGRRVLDGLAPYVGAAVVCLLPTRPLANALGLSIRDAMVAGAGGFVLSILLIFNAQVK
jgi:hypothetical protein